MKILFLMIFLHIIDDFGFQPLCLSKLKQKEFWEKNAPDEMYEHDYIAALIIHGLSWSIMVHLPFIFTCDNEILLTLSILGNGLFHSFVDDLKANKKWINLIIDQSFHLIQIIITFCFFIKI